MLVIRVGNGFDGDPGIGIRIAISAAFWTFMGDFLDAIIGGVGIVPLGVDGVDALGTPRSMFTHSSLLTSFVKLAHQVSKLG